MMGTSGNRPSNKVFSISTTIRNPKRNTDFLNAFKPFSGKVLDDNNMNRFMYELVKKGIYKFSNLTEQVKTKLELEIELTDDEVKEAIDNNPQATGQRGRVMTWLRSLKDQGFLMFEDNKIFITKLGYSLIENNENATNIYSKAMIGLHANNPSRPAMFNKARPFLNTLFVINEVNKAWKEMGNEPKGILKHEFSYFVLSMTDCDYKKAASEIINYRKTYRYESNQKFAEKYLQEKGLPPLKENSLLRDYPDDVFKKFEMTGLLRQRGKFGYIYYDFSKYNKEKVNTILSYYKDFKFEEFLTQKEYFEFLSNIVIPWENNDIIRNKIVEAKSKVLGISLSETLTIDEKEEYLDRMFYSSALSKAVEKYDIKLILKELLILSKSCKEKSKFEDISEPLRLEYLLALSLGKLYGTEGLVSNIIYNEDGLPLHCAPGGKCDIQLIREEGSYILEPTMQRSRNQQNNNETTNIARHVRDEFKKNNLKYRVAMVAPAVHPDVIDYFVYASDRNNVSMITTTINVMAALFKNSDSISKLNNNFDIVFKEMIGNDVEIFADKINRYVPVI